MSVLPFILTSYRQDAALQRRYGFSTGFPAEKTGGVTIRVAARKD
jgi:hypothetical protein